MSNIRKIDTIGRIVIPIEMREKLGWRTGDVVEVSLQDTGISITNHKSKCLFCESEEDLKEFRGYRVCKQCQESLNG